MARSVQTWRTGEKVIGGAAVGTIVGAFLPWVSVFGVNVSGLHGDGVITLVVGLIGAAVLIVHAGLGRLNRSLFWIELVAGGIVALTALIDTANGAGAIGLYLTLFSGIAWIAGAFMCRRRPTSGTDAPGAGSLGSEAKG